jgi:hypothetical protein
MRENIRATDCHATPRYHNHCAIHHRTAFAL